MRHTDKLVISVNFLPNVTAIHIADFYDGKRIETGDLSTKRAVVADASRYLHQRHQWSDKDKI